MGHLTDDELANGAFMNYDRKITEPGAIEQIIAGTRHSPIAWMTAVKDRIRWLSRRLVEATTIDWSKSDTPPAATWKNEMYSPVKCLEIADGAIHHRDLIIKNLRSQLDTLRGRAVGNVDPVDLSIHLHSISKAMESSGVVYSDDNPSYYGAILDVMKIVSILNAANEEGMAAAEATSGVVASGWSITAAKEGIIKSANVPLEALGTTPPHEWKAGEFRLWRLGSDPGWHGDAMIDYETANAALTAARATEQFEMLPTEYEIRRFLPEAKGQGA